MSTEPNDGLRNKLNRENYGQPQRPLIPAPLIWASVGLIALMGFAASFSRAPSWHLKNGKTFRSKLVKYDPDRRWAEFQGYPQTRLTELFPADQKRILVWFAKSNGDIGPQKEGDGLSTPMTWTLINGKTLYGRVTQSRKDRVEFMDDRGQTVTVAYDALPFPSQNKVYGFLQNEGIKHSLPMPHHPDVKTFQDGRVASEDGFDPYLIARDAETSNKPYILMYGAFGIAILILAMRRAKFRLRVRKILWGKH